MATSPPPSQLSIRRMIRSSDTIINFGINLSVLAVSIQGNFPDLQILDNRQISYIVATAQKVHNDRDRINHIAVRGEDVVVNAR
jgi:hypothetical protein